MSKQLPYRTDLAAGQEIRIRALEHELRTVRQGLRLVADALEQAGDPTTAEQLRELLGSAVPVRTGRAGRV